MTSIRRIAQLSGDPGNPNLNPGLNSCAAHPQGVLFYEVGPRIQDFDTGDTPSFASTPTGLRATGGLLVTPRSTLTTSPPRRINSWSPGLARPTLAGAGWPSQDDLVPVPYVGVGYSDLSNRSGWGFRADLGLMALRPQSAVRLGSTLSGAQGIDTLLNGMQLSPVMQIGVSYSF